MSIGEILNKTFGHVYVKNLSESTERKRLIEESFDKVGLNYSIERAYDGKLDNTTEFSYRKCTHGSQAAGSHAVAINRKTYNSFFEKTIRFEFWGDGCIDQLIQEGANVYMITPSLIFQDRNSISTINKIKSTDYLIPRNV